DGHAEDVVLDQALAESEAGEGGPVAHLERGRQSVEAVGCENLPGLRQQPLDRRLDEDDEEVVGRVPRQRGDRRAHADARLLRLTLLCRVPASWCRSFRAHGDSKSDVEGATAEDARQGRRWPPLSPRRLPPPRTSQ